MFQEVDDIVTYLIVTGNDDITIRAAQRMMHREGLHTTVTFVLEIWGVNIVTNT